MQWFQTIRDCRALACEKQSDSISDHMLRIVKLRFPFAAGVLAIALVTFGFRPVLGEAITSCRAAKNRTRKPDVVRSAAHT
jgi:hypothetical protein